MLKNKIYCGDNITLSQQLERETVDLTVTSPPYDSIYSYGGNVTSVFHWKPIIKELYRVTKHGGIVVWVVGSQVKNGCESVAPFKQAIAFTDIGWRLHDTMIYQKNNFYFPNPNRYYQVFEYMFVFSKGKPKTANLLKDRPNKTAGDKSHTYVTRRNKDGERKISKPESTVVDEYGVRGNVWTYKVGKGHSTNDKIAFEHPAIFPEKLAEDHILSWSNPGDLVFDPFVGSGTTAKMAKLNGRNYIGFDGVQEYVDIANERLNSI